MSLHRSPDQLAAEVAATTQAEASAVTLINGIAGRVQSAIDAALVNGATAAELQPVTDEVAALNAQNQALAAAIAANTPAAP